MKLNRQLIQRRKENRTFQKSSSSQDPIVFYSMSELIYRLVWKITFQTVFISVATIAALPLASQLPTQAYISELAESSNLSSLVTSVSEVR